MKKNPQSETNLTMQEGQASLRKISKEEQAYRKIKEKFYTCKLIPGQKIIFRDLEEMLGMSKTPITSALARLEQEGLLISMHNRGYYVKRLSKSEIRQLYDVRIRLEEIAVEYAVKNCGPKELEVLRSKIDAYLEYKCEHYDSTRLKLDIDFHLQIARIGGNKYLLSLLMQIYGQTLVGLPASFMTPMIPRFKQDHLQIYKAIKNNEGNKAKKLIRKHEMITLQLIDTVNYNFIE